MKSTAKIDNSVNKALTEIFRYFDWSNAGYDDDDPVKNIVNATRFEDAILHFNEFGADVECYTYRDVDYLKIGYARINSHEFVKNGEFIIRELLAALYEIAAPEAEADSQVTVKQTVK